MRSSRQGEWGMENGRRGNRKYQDKGKEFVLEC